MTIQEAHQFVRRWRRIFIPWPSPHTDTDAARALERAFLGISVGIIVSPLPVILCFAGRDTFHLSGWWFAVVITVLVLAIAFRRLGSYFGVARHLLEESEAQHLSDLREHLYDKPSA